MVSISYLEVSQDGIGGSAQLMRHQSSHAGDRIHGTAGAVTGASPLRNASAWLDPAARVSYGSIDVRHTHDYLKMFWSMNAAFAADGTKSSQRSSYTGTTSRQRFHRGRWFVERRSSPGTRRGEARVTCSAERKGLVPVWSSIGIEPVLLTTEVTKSRRGK